MKKKLLLLTICSGLVSMAFGQSQRHISFNAEWTIGDSKELITLPRAWNEDDAFRVSIEQLPDSVVWYRKEFSLSDLKNKKVFIEFEGVRQAAEVFVNGKSIGMSENGVMAFGFDISSYVTKGKNLLEVRTDNDWEYREKSSNSRYQWNDRNFNVNYGGITKNVWLHITDEVYQTLPLYSNLQTTGTYVYLVNADIDNHTATIGIESEVRNDSRQARTFKLQTLFPASLKAQNVGSNSQITLLPGETRVMKAQYSVSNVAWWSIGQGNLYDIVTQLVDTKGKVFDEVITCTGFRTTRFGNGLIELNNKVIQVKGYAQRTSNEWPAVGISVPAWLSDYSNRMMVESGANTVRWMHITPWKQDIESCDRVGLMQAMPAGDSEKDVEGDRWRHRTEVMRDAIIYNRNNPSIIFYEGGNESISRQHMLELIAIRDKYDPHGGRAVGSREMLDINEAEYGGEMLYINKSKKHPMWAMEYCRDEGLRKNYDSYSYPYHREGDGPLHKNQPANAYNHNQDEFVVELVRRWYDYWRERPGTGTRVSSGGVKIIFSDTNTHHRGVENYRRSGVTDPLRIPKDAFFAHQVMWHGWVDQPNDNPQLSFPNDQQQTYIVGHWNYEDGRRIGQITHTDDFSKPVYVVSNAVQVELFLNGKSLGNGNQRYRFLYIWPNVRWEAGELIAIGRDAQGKELSRHSIRTAGKAAALCLTKIENPKGWQANGADLELIEIEVVDSNGQRCPIDNRIVRFTLTGPAEWRGGMAQGPDNYILSKSLPVECGVNRVILRSTTTPGTVILRAEAEGLPAQTLTLQTRKSSPVTSNAYVTKPKSYLSDSKLNLPVTPTFIPTKVGVEIVSAKSDANSEQIKASYDDNELSEWRGGTEVTYTLAQNAPIDDICVKMAGWRSTNYAIEILADNQVIWRGVTPTSLGYVHLTIDHPVNSRNYTLRAVDRESIRGQVENFKDPEAARFSNITEVAGGKASELDATAKARGNVQPLRIVEIEFLKKVN